MRKLIAIAGSFLIIAGLLPTLALAKDNNQSFIKLNKPNVNPGLHLGLTFNHLSLFKTQRADNDNDADDAVLPPNPPPVPPVLPLPPMRGHSGTVGTTTVSGFSLTDKTGATWIVNVGSTTIMTAFGQNITLADVTTGSHANVQGTAFGNTINATKIVISPANTHPASGLGTVTAVNGNNFTLQMNNRGIVSSATVNTNSSTTVTHNGATTTTSSIVVGSKVAVHGLWDELLNVLNAIKIKIF